MCRGPRWPGLGQSRAESAWATPQGDRPQSAGTSPRRKPRVSSRCEQLLWPEMQRPSQQVQEAPETPVGAATSWGGPGKGAAAFQTRASDTERPPPSEGNPGRRRGPAAHRGVGAGWLQLGPAPAPPGARGLDHRLRVAHHRVAGWLLQPPVFPHGHHAVHGQEERVAAGQDVSVRGGDQEEPGGYDCAPPGGLLRLRALHGR